MDYKVKNIDDNRFELTINIVKEDYMDEVNRLLKKKRNETTLKGFRKGKTPMGFLRKTFGNGIIADVVNKKIDEGLSDYLKENKIELLLSPIASENQEPLDIDINNQKDFSVYFDLHKKPDFELKGISETDEYTYYDIDVDTKILDSEVERLGKQFGKFEPFEGKLTEDKFITVFIKELDGDNVKENGYESEFTVKIDELTDDYKKKILKLNKGDEFTLDVYKFLKDADEAKVKDYLLNIDNKDFEEGEDMGIGNMYIGTIKNTEEFIPAELDEEFFKTQNIPNVKNEEEYRDFVASDIKKHYNSESDKMLQLEIAERLKEVNEITFSDGYIERWIHEQYPDKSEKEIKDNLEASEKDLQWQSIVDKLTKKYNVEVTKEDLAQRMEEQAKSMIGNNPEMIHQMMEYMLKDEKLVNNTYNELFIDKIFGAASLDIIKKEEKISWEKFIKLADKYKQKAEENTGKEEEE